MLIGICCCLSVLVHAAAVTLNYDLSGNRSSVQDASSPALPTIVSPPASVLASTSSAVSFSVNVASDSPVTYQWKFNTNDLGGETGDTLYLPSVTSAKAGSYTVVVTNTQGSVTSSPAILTVDFQEVVPWGPDLSGLLTPPATLKNVIAIAEGLISSSLDRIFSLALNMDGTVVGWGDDTYAQLSPPPGLTNVVSIAAGKDHSLALKSDGTVVGWGRNSYYGVVITIPAGLSDVVAIAAGNSFSLALKSDGTVIGWGLNTSGQTTIPQGLNTVVAIAAGNTHSLALKSDGTVVAWGDNTSGQTSLPAGMGNVVAIATSSTHSLALRSDGTVVAWGGTNTYGETTIPGGLSNVVAIAAASAHSLALKSDGTVVSWGYYDQSTVPAGLGSVVSIAAGGYGSLALRSANPGFSNPLVLNVPFAAMGVDSPFSYRILARNSPTSYAATGMPPGLTLNTSTGVISGTPTTGGTYAVNISVTNASGTSEVTVTFTVNLPLPTIISALAVAAYKDFPFNYQITASNSAPTSYNATGLPAGLTINTATGLISGTPTATGSSSVTISATNAYGTSMATLALSVINYAEVVAWGDNDDGQATVPAGLSNVVAVAGTISHSLALKSDGTVVAWGEDGDAQTSVPAGLNNVVAISAGWLNCYALKADRTMVEWRADGYANGTQVPAGLTNVVSITSDDLALKSDGTVVTWGDVTPPPAGLSAVVAISAGQSHWVALKANGTVVAWGSNVGGSTTVPAGLSGVVAIAAGGFHTLALKSDGTVVAWGADTSGDTTVPVGLSNVVAIAAGYAHSLALKADGTVVAWGNNNSGQTTLPLSLGNVVAIASAYDAWHSLALLGTEPSVPQPVIINSPFAMANKNSTFSQRVVAQNSPTSFGATGLPAGLSINASTGVISGTPTVSGTFAVTLSATNASGTGTRGLTLYVMNVAFPAIAVQQAGTPLISGDLNNIKDFGGAKLLNGVTKVFTIKNTGLGALSGFAFTFSGGATAYSVTVPPAASVVGGGSTTFTVTFKPTTTGANPTRMGIVSNDTAHSPFDVYLTGTGIVVPTVTDPVSRLLTVGQTATFTVSATGGALNYQWLKNGVAITGATAASYTIPTVSIANAGSYTCKVTNAAGSDTSSKAELGVVDTTAKSLLLASVGTATMTATTAGNTLTYAWERVGGALPGKVIVTTAKTLSISSLVAADSGNYRCAVSGPGGGPVISGIFTLTVFDTKPEITPVPAPMPDAYVSGSYSFQIPVNSAPNRTPTSYAATGLPAGLICNATSGLITGKPTVSKATPYAVVLKAINSKDTGLASTTLLVHPLPDNAMGTFNALIARDTTISAPIATPAGLKLQGHGGSLDNLVVTSTGTFTASLKMEDKSYAMPVASKLDAHGTGNPTAAVIIKRGTGIANLTMNLTINVTTGELTGTVSDGLVATPVNLQGWRNPWKTTGTLASPAHPASELAASYKAMLDFADNTLEGNAAYPQGIGYGTLTVTTAGLATWSGALADGTAVTRSTTLGPNGEVPLHWMLYTPTVAATAGSAHGWVQVLAGGDTTKPDDNLLDTMLDLTQVAAQDQPIFDWVKKPQTITSTARSYKGGFLLHKLKIIGGGYVKPLTGVRVLALGNTTNNAKLTFSSANVETAVTYLNVANGGPSASMNGKLFTITSANAVVMPTLPSAAVANPATLVLKLDATTGAISGSYTLKSDPDPTKPGTFLSRTVNYYGVLVPRLGKGYGCFQLPQLPANGPPKTTLSTSPQLSGQVLLEAGP